MHLVHRLVAETFIDKPSYCPLCKVKFEVNHKDGNGMNNHIDNLEFCTRQENMDKSTKKRQEGCIKKLNENIIKDIKTEILKNNESNVTMAKKYNISNGTVCDIIKGRLWKHVTI
jgi:hypothetical protein